MDTQEDILAIYIWLMHLPTFKKTLSFLCETIARKKDLRNILLLQTKYKYKVGYDSISIFLYSFILRENAVPIYSLIHVHSYIGID